MPKVVSIAIWKTYHGRHLLAQSQYCKHQINVQNIFKVNNKHTRTKSEVVLVSLLLHLNIFHTLF